MKKAITFIFFAFLLFIGKSYAVNNDSTAYAKECFQKAKTEIENMLSGNIPLNYERAVFLTENAYWGNVFNDSLFSDLIEFHSQNIKILAESNRIKNADDFKSDFISTKEQKQKYYDNALYNWAIFKYLTDTTLFYLMDDVYVHYPSKYSISDPLGTIEWKNSQVLSLLNSEINTGNCMAMTSLFKIFSERLNTNARIGTAPGHVFIIHNDDKDIEYNIELATHSFPGAGSLMTLTYTSDKALQNGISMRTLNTKQSITLCLVYLAKGYEHKFNVKVNDFMLQCAETALQYDSLNLNAMLLKAEVLEARLIETKKTIKQLQNYSLFIQYQNLLSSLLEKGYYEMPSEMKDIILSKLRGIDIPYFAVDHTPQPFKNINVKEDRYATLSGGLFDENPQPKEIERYGKTLFNSKTKNIIEFNEPDSTFSNYPLDPVVFAWSVDPLTSKYPNLSPYVAFENNPIYFNDPNGKDATYTIEGNTITVSSTIFIMGEGATKEKAAEMQNQIMSLWNNGKKGQSYTDPKTGQVYSIKFDIQVKTLEEGKTKDITTFGNNLVYLSKQPHMEGGRSYVVNGNKGEWKKDPDVNDTYPHEYGHMLGIVDLYVELEPAESLVPIGNFNPQPYTDFITDDAAQEGNIMGNMSNSKENFVGQSTINALGEYMLSNQNKDGKGGLSIKSKILGDKRNSFIADKKQAGWNEKKPKSVPLY